MAGRLGRPVEKRHQVASIEFEIRGRRGSSGSQGGRQDVERRHRSVDRGPRRDRRRPAQQVRHADAALVVGQLAAGERLARAQPGEVAGAAVVRQEDDQRVVGDPRFLQGVEDPADRVVERGDHPEVDPPQFVLLVGEPVVVLLRDLERRVRRVERRVEEERLIGVPADEVDRLVAEDVGDVGRLVDHRLLRPAQDEVARPTRRRRGRLRPPDDQIGARVLRRPAPEIVVGRHRHGAFRPPVDEPGGAGEMPVELVETAVHRVVLILEAQVPLADDAGRVAGRLQVIGDRQLSGDEPDVRHFRRLSGVVLEAVPLLVAAGQQRGARRRTDRRRHVALGEHGPLPADPVDVRGL